MPYLLSIAHNYVVNLPLTRETREALVDFVRLIYAKKAAFWFSEQAGIILDGVSFCWRIYDSEHLFNMRLQELLYIRNEMAHSYVDQRNNHDTL